MTKRRCLVVSPHENVSSPANENARIFVRSLNILLKYSRLYGEGHARTVAQFESAWKELSEAQERSQGAGLIIGAADDQLLADGVPLGAGTAERSLVQLMNNAGVASLYFSPATSPQDFGGLLHTLVSSGKSPRAFEEAWKQQ